MRSDSALITSCGSRVRITIVRESSLRTFASEEISRSPTTTRSGWRSARLPSGSRAVSFGSSTKTVPVPTTMASAAARRRCTSARAASLVIHWLLPSAAALRPSTLVANFQVTCGSPVRCLCSHSRSGPPATSSASTPATTSTPDSASRDAPPAATGFGSATA